MCGSFFRKTTTTTTTTKLQQKDFQTKLRVKDEDFISTQSG